MSAVDRYTAHGHPCIAPLDPHAALVSEAQSDPRYVARALEEIAILLDLSGENAFKVRAYERGARLVEDLDDRVFALIESDELTAVEGIGEKLASQIVDLATTGKSQVLDRLRAQHPPGAVELARIPGMTIKRMRALHEALGVTSVGELRQACVEQRVRALKGFGPKTEERLLKAVERAAEPAAPQRVLLRDGLALARRIETALVGGGSASAVVVGGAARRCEETLGELELLVVTRDVERVWQRVLRMPWVSRVEREASRARLSQGIALVLHFATPEQAGLGLLLATGPQPHVERLRARARERGAELETLARENEEAALYRALDLPFVPPELRGSPNDLDPSGYGDLLRVEDIRGFVHCHTVYSDGRATIEEMARAAEALGMLYITITDHSPSAHYARGVALDRVKEQWDEIARVQELVPGVRILRGTESDILADGALDYPDELLERFDVVIASIHARHKQDRAAMTARLTRAMGLPIFKIWGHALGRILLSRDPVDCDVPAVLDALAASRGAIELNADPHRLDLPPEWIRPARERGIPFVVSVDAHSTEGLEVLPLGVQLARRGGLKRHEVLNTLPAAEFMQRVRPH